VTADHAARDVSIVCTPVPPELIPADFDGVEYLIRCT
jgi:hypothetical protein